VDADVVAVGASLAVVRASSIDLDAADICAFHEGEGADKVQGHDSHEGDSREEDEEAFASELLQRAVAVVDLLALDPERSLKLLLLWSSLRYLKHSKGDQQQDSNFEHRSSMLPMVHGVENVFVAAVGVIEHSEAIEMMILGPMMMTLDKPTLVVDRVPVVVGNVDWFEDAEDHAAANHPVPLVDRVLALALHEEACDERAVAGVLMCEGHAVTFDDDETLHQAVEEVEDNRGGHMDGVVALRHNLTFEEEEEADGMVLHREAPSLDNKDEEHDDEHRLKNAEVREGAPAILLSQL